MEEAGRVVAAVEKLFNDYGNVWPPRGDFSDWPAAWSTYMEMGDQLADKLAEMTEAEQFREWTKEMLKQVNLDEVMIQVKRNLTKDNNKLIGLGTCLTFLKNSYRWGTLPVNNSERKRTSLEFPDKLAVPLNEIISLHGISSHGNFFTLFYANSVYDENGVPADVKFRFNKDPDVFSMEKEFFVQTVKMELQFYPAVRAAAEFIRQTAMAKESRENALKTLDSRLQLMDIIKDSVTKALKEFIIFTTWGKVKRKQWTMYIESMMAWGIDGENGTSGAETFIATFLDEFFHVPGTSFVFRAKPENYGRMAESIVDVLHAVRMDDPKQRFNTFLRNSLDEDEIWARRSDILRVLHMWRLSHARVAERVIASSEGLASGLDEELGEGESLSSGIKRALDERAQETKQAYHNLQKDDTPNKDDSSTTEKLLRNGGYLISKIFHNILSNQTSHNSF